MHVQCSMLMDSAQCGPGIGLVEFLSQKEQNDDRISIWFILHEFHCSLFVRMFARSLIVVCTIFFRRRHYFSWNILVNMSIFHFTFFTAKKNILFFSNQTRTHWHDVWHFHCHIDNWIDTSCEITIVTHNRKWGRR